MNNNNFLIEQDDILSAQMICSSIESDSIRNRAMANVVAANIVKGYFQDFEIDISSGIHNIPFVLNQIDISDIYIKGNYIDVRVYFNENELCIPKSHFVLGALPVAYMFVKLDSDLAEGQVTGFISPSDIDTGNYTDYIPIKEDMLKSFYDIEPEIATIDEVDITPEFKISVFEFLDGKLDDERNFYKTLIVSRAAREYLANSAKAKVLFNDMFVQDADSMGEEEQVYEDDLAVDDVLDSGNDTFDELPSIDDSEDLMPFDSDEPDELQEQEGSLDEDFSEGVDLSENQVEELADASDDIEEYIPIEDDDMIPEDVVQDKFEEETFDNAQPDDIEELVDADTLENYEEVSQTYDNEEDNQSVEDNELEELSDFDYTTEVSPSISTIETSGEDVDTVETVPEESIEYEDNSEPQIISEENENTEQIENLFDGSTQGEVNVPVKRKKSIIPFLAVAVAVGAAGYFSYTKFFNPIESTNNIPETNMNVENTGVASVADENKIEAMPLETVENIDTQKPTEEAASVSIPAIEKNLNATIEISNLAINWEVPTEYAKNITAKRYLVKIGKILQLNLKTELLFLNTPPITNKISVALEFDASRNKFIIKNVIDSSGVQNVDAVIKDTISRVLDMNMNVNMSVFNNLQGNPVLVIKL